MTRFLRILKSDMINGLWETRKTIVLFVVLFVFLVLAFYLRLGDMASDNEMTIAQTIDKYGPFSTGDLLAYFMKGMRKWVIADDGAFPFPAAWMMLVALVLYLTLWYPYHDLNGFGVQMLVQGGSRWLWWFSKCAWVVLWSLIPCLIALLVAWIWAMASGSSPAFSIAEGLRWVLRQEPSLQPESSESIISFLMSAPVIFASLGLAQLALSLAIRPLLSFVVCFSVLFLSAFFTEPYLVGNYLMSLRTSALMEAGLNPLMGLFIAVIVAGLSVMLGGLVFSKTNIIEKEFDS